MSYGRVPLGNTFLRYDLYMGNGEDSTGSGDSDVHKSSGYRLALEIPLFTHIEFGISGYEDDRKANGVNEEKSATGYHVKIHWNVLDFQAEYATSDHTPVTGEAYFREGFYSQLALRFGKYTYGVRNDFYNVYKKITQLDGLKALQQYETTKNSVFFNFRITKDLVFKLEHHIVEPDDINNVDQSYNITMASIAVNLGN